MHIQKEITKYLECPYLLAVCWAVYKIQIQPLKHLSLYELFSHTQQKFYYGVGFPSGRVEAMTLHLYVIQFGKPLGHLEEINWCLYIAIELRKLVKFFETHYQCK